MKLYLLRPTTPSRPWYDTAQGFVVRAHNDETARVLADLKGGDESHSEWNPTKPHVWLDPLTTTCECIGICDDGGVQEVVLRDFASA